MNQSAGRVFQNLGSFTRAQGLSSEYTQGAALRLLHWTAAESSKSLYRLVTWRIGKQEKLYTHFGSLYSRAQLITSGSPVCGGRHGGWPDTFLICNIVRFLEETLFSWFILRESFYYLIFTMIN